MTLKAKLIALIAAGLVAIGVLSGSTFYTMNALKFSLDDIGTNRLPSVAALFQMKTAVQDVRMSILTAAVYENDYKAQATFAALLEKSSKNWLAYEKGLKIYDALPQEKEEEEVWKNYVREITDYRTGYRKVAGYLEQLSRNTDPKRQVELFPEFYKARDDAGKILAQAFVSLDKLIELNIQYGNMAVKAGEQTSDKVKTLTIVMSLLAAIAVFLIGLFILRSTFKQLGGEPALATEIANKIAKGDMSSEIIVTEGDTSSLLAAMKRMASAINALTSDAVLLTKAAVEGKLATRADASQHQGDFQKVVIGVNNTLDAVIGPLNVTAKYVDDISKGIIPPIITDSYNGDFNIIKNNLNNVVKMMSDLLAQTDIIIQGAANGELKKRANADLFVGGWNQLVKGVNDTITNIVNPLNVTANYVDRISRGDIPPKITDPYSGDYNIIKNNLNTCIDAVNALVADAGLLAKAAVEGRLETRADASQHQGDFQKIVIGVNDTLDNVVGPINEVRRIMGAMSGGDLSQTITTAYRGDFDELKSAINQTVVKLVEIIGEVRAAADNLTNAAGQVSATAQSLSQSSSEQAASVEETTSSMEQMTASISQNTENAKITDGMAAKAAKEAAEGGEAVTKTVDDMKSIASKIGIIDDIAYQTNLLALNAAIEAARAGDHGKGFAVVAAEVRKLAERSQIAAQEIGNLASSSVKQAERAGTLLTEMVPTIRKTSDLVQEIASASSEQSSGVAQINGAMGQLNQATQQNASASEQLAATAEELGSQAEQLQQTMTFFRLDDSSRNNARKAPPVTRASGGKGKASTRTAAVQINEGDFERY